MSELKACPFCGCDSADFMPDRLMAPGADPPVFCNECHASAMDAAAWNCRADDWHPIATAPRDGRDVIAWSDGRARILAWDDYDTVWLDVDGMPKPPPTHWRPLPEKPTI